MYTCVNRCKGCKSKRVNADLLESTVIAVIQNQILADDAIDKAANDLKEILKDFMDDSAEMVVKLKKDLESTKKKINSLFGLMLAGTIDQEVVQTQTDRYLEEQKLITNRIREIESSTDDLSTDTIVELIKTFRNITINSNSVEKLLLINHYTDRIVIGRNRTKRQAQMNLLLLLQFLEEISCFMQRDMLLLIGTSNKDGPVV